MPSTPIKSCNKYVLSYKDSSNKIIKLALIHSVYMTDKHLRENLTLLYDHPDSCNKNQTIILRKLIMNLKKSPFAIQDKNARELGSAKDYPTISDLMREQKVSNNDSNSVHHRRDLDSLG